MNKKTSNTFNIRILIVLAAFAFVVTCTVIFMNPSKAVANNNKQIHISYDSVLIEPGDTIWSIAEDHLNSEWGTVSDYVYKIMKVNDMKSDIIYAGNYIIVPIYTITYAENQ